MAKTPRGPLWDWVGLDPILEALNRIEDKLDAIAGGARDFWQESKERDMAEKDEIDNLVQRVSANRDAVQAAQLAMSGMLDRIAAQGKELADAIAAASDVSPQIRQAADDLAANTAALQDAVPHIAQAIVQGTKAQ